MARPRVFISSTFYDLRQIRDDLERFVRDLGYEPVRHETGAIPYGQELPPEEYAYREVETCDIVVAVIGGRFGSTSAQDTSQSVSQLELRRALDHQIQVFIFVDKNVRSEFHTYQLNKDNPGIRYRFVDDVRIYAFIEELFQLPCNNPISTFETCSDIIEYLRAQWAGLFQRFLHERRLGSDHKSASLHLSGLQDLTSTTVDAVLRQLSGESNELPDGIVALKWAVGPTTLDIEVVDVSPKVLESFSLQVLDIHRWSDEHPRFVEVPDIHEKERFAPVTLHIHPVAANDRGYVFSAGTYRLLQDTPLTFLFLSLEGDHLQFGGQRGSVVGTHTIRTPGTWRVSVRAILRGLTSGSQGQTVQFARTSFLFFKWDGATAPVPCAAPIAS